VTTAPFAFLSGLAAAFLLEAYRTAHLAIQSEPNEGLVAVPLAAFADDMALRLQFLDVDEVLRAAELCYLPSRNPLTDLIAQ
jgi:hypothetical protein